MILRAGGINRTVSRRMRIMGDLVMEVGDDFLSLAPGNVAEDMLTRYGSVRCYNSRQLEKGGAYQGCLAWLMNFVKPISRLRLPSDR